ncbi:MAG: type II toxin-antitoxin system Phd/YefM family antitoxin [Xanthomonadales bacterium]|jgi:prevent-host-death family protein|nr:type II toxin-antitoxin system Phd/YefM family antitoxin [Xanthomonadales bacterium]
MDVWALQDAKARLSEVVRLAMERGPQEITLRGEPAVVVIAKQELDRLRHPRPGFVELMRASPLADYELDLTRDRSPIREVDW